MEEIKKNIMTLIAAAAAASDPGDAMKLSQAALNATNAALGLKNLDRTEPPK